MRRVLAAAFALCIAAPAFAQSGLLPANQVWAGPTSGGQGFARARALVGADVPAPGASSLGGVQSLTCSSSNWFRTLSTGGVFGCSQPAITDISGLGAGVATALGIAPGSAGGPVLFNGAGGTPSSLVAANATGTAAGLTAGHVTTNANSTGDVTSVGNATTLAAGNAGNLNSGTLAAARMPALTGDCTTVAGAVATNCTKLNSVPFAVTAPAVWTPTDASGASLVFTSVDGTWQQIGNYVIASATLTYPSTANGSNAAIGGLPVAFPGAGHSRQCTVSGSSVATLVGLLPNPSSTVIVPKSASLGALTNTQMSTALLFFQCIYPAI